MSRTILPKRLSESILVEGTNPIRLFSHYFGKLPYGRVAISQQPDPSFGQAWPMLGYLPLTAFMDSTQRHFLFGSATLQSFIDEVGSHEIAHQWWGHLVGWKTYHDKWLSEEFASFSAGLYRQLTKNHDRTTTYWRRQRKNALEKNEFEYAPNDAGPLWLGQRLGMAEKLTGSYRLVYAKGAFVLHMLRMLMWEPQKKDERFIAMMKDFTQTYALRRASTEGFKRIAEKHITPNLDVRKNGKLDWFFDQWVYGSEIPRYKFNSQLKDEGDGQYTLSVELTQSEVSAEFVMPVPIYLDFGQNRYAPLGRITIDGNRTITFNQRIRLPQKPKRLVINANEDILCFQDGRP